MSEMKTSEVLDLAADMIEGRGWTMGTEGWGGNHTAPLCLEGGVLAALGHPGFVGITHTEMWNCPAYKAVQEYLECGLELWRWNDTYGRTQAEVIEVLRAAAAVERAKEESLEGSVTKKELVK